MFDLKHACHKVYVIKYHLMFAVKYRKDLFLNDAYVEHLKLVLKQIEKRCFLTSETVGFDEDHVHILMHAASRYSPSRAVQIVESITAREMFRKFPEIKDPEVQCKTCNRDLYAEYGFCSKNCSANYLKKG